MRGLAFACALAAPLLLSGCVSYPCVPGPLVSARGIGPDTPAAGGNGSFELQVLVTDPDGRPVPGAGVVVYWGTQSPDDFADEASRPEAGNASEPVEPGRTAGTPHNEQALRLRTGADGRVLARTPSARLVGLVAAADGYTEEWIGYLPTGGAGQASTASIVLYPAVLTWSIDGTLSPGAVSTGQIIAGNHVWSPTTLDLPGPRDDLVLARLVSLAVNVTWTNEPLSFGDLGVGLGHGGQHRYFADAHDDIALGQRSESGDLGLPQILEHGFHGAPSLQAGPASDLGYLAPLGLAYRLEVRAVFDRAEADQNNCLYVAQGGGGGRSVADGPGVSAPGAGLWAIGVLFGVAAVVRRRAT